MINERLDSIFKKVELSHASVLIKELIQLQDNTNQLNES